MSTNIASNRLPDLNELDQRHVSRLTQILRDGEAKREREKNWREYTSKDGKITIQYVALNESYTDAFGVVKKVNCIEVKRAFADVSSDDSYSGLIEAAAIEVEAELAEGTDD